MNYTVYDKNTGDIISVVSTNDDAVRDLMLQNCTYLPGEYDAETHYVSGGQVLEKTPAPGPYHRWSNGTWHFDANMAEAMHRQDRMTRLAQIDAVNAVWYASLSADQQQELQAYRVALLGVPQQAGFPTLIEWPTKPPWL